MYDRYEKPSSWVLIEKEARRGKQVAKPTYRDKLIDQNKRRTDARKETKEMGMKQVVKSCHFTRRIIQDL